MFIEADGQAPAGELQTHWAVIITHHGKWWTLLLVVDKPGGSLLNTKGRVTLPAVNQGEERPLVRIDLSVCRAPWWVTRVGVIDPAQYQVMTDRKRVHATDSAQGRCRSWALWVRARAVRGRRSRRRGREG